MTRDRLRRAATLLGYGAALAAGTLLLDWIDYRRAMRAMPASVAVAVAGTAFLALGLFLGWRLTRPAQPLREPEATLGISARERTVLEALAAGLSNKEIARRLDVSPNTVKTHLSNLYAKLEARRRTEAIARARAMGLLP
ncbi:response regulator transcription factor [Sphingomonas sp.]|uniref:helix-turn-helix transcriptional regulator n=1 Tax=Sphingomonas sp. TaxID=28214 RepID=UPI0035C79063